MSKLYTLQHNRFVGGGPCPAKYRHTSLLFPHLLHHRLHHLATRDPTDQLDLPNHLAWQVNHTIEHDNMNLEATGIIGETVVPTVDEGGKPVIQGAEAIRGKQEDCEWQKMPQMDLGREALVPVISGKYEYQERVASCSLQSNTERRVESMALEDYPYLTACRRGFNSRRYRHNPCRGSPPAQARAGRRPRVSGAAETDVCVLLFLSPAAAS